jgi:5,10-methylenetetrahydromethanopterin reductase
LPAIGWHGTVADIVALAQLCEEVGFDRFAVADYRFYHDCFTVMTACLRATRRLEVESLVTDPYVRHPSLSAVSVATMNDLSGGRAILGLGGGQEQPAFWGETREHPAQAVREAVGVARSLWSGGEVTYNGEVIRAYAARLNFTPRATPRILIAARGQRMLQLAGEVADIAHLASLFVNAGHQRDNIDMVLAGAARAARPADSFEIDVSVPISVSRDREQARRRARRVAAQGLLWIAGAEKYSRERRDWRRPFQLDVSESLIESLSRWPMWDQAELPEDLAAQIPDHVLDQFSVAGEPGECAARLRDLVHALPQVTGVRLKLPPPLGATAVADYRTMIAEIGDVLRSVRDSNAPTSASMSDEGSSREPDPVP